MYLQLQLQTIKIKLYFKYIYSEKNPCWKIKCFQQNHQWDAYFFNFILLLQYHAVKKIFYFLHISSILIFYTMFSIIKHILIPNIDNINQYKNSSKLIH